MGEQQGRHSSTFKRETYLVQLEFITDSPTNMSFAIICNATNDETIYSAAY